MEPFTPRQPDASSALVRDHRVHYEVCRDTVLRRDGRRTLAVGVRLRGTLPPGAAAMPGEPACRGTCLALTRLAEAVVARAESGAEAEIEPFRSALYASRQQPGRDEIELGITLRSRAGLSRAGEEDRERRLRELRRRLEALGVFEGAWRETPRAAGCGDWEVRPPAQVFQAAPRPAAVPRRAGASTGATPRPLAAAVPAG